MTFTKAQIATVRTGINSAGPAPAFDPNGNTMQTLPSTNGISTTAPVNSNPVINGIKSTASDVYNNLKNSFQSGIKQIVSGFKQTQTGANDTSNIPEGAGMILEGAGQEVAGGINTILSPFSSLFKDAADIPIPGQGANAGDNFNKNVINPVANAIASHPLIQKIVQKYPGIEEDLPNLLTIGAAIAGGANADEIGTAVSDAKDTTVDVTKSAVDAIKKTVKPAPAGAPAPIDTLSSRIQDATPNYNKNMVGTNVMTPDTIDTQGNVIKGQITPRVNVDVNASNEGLGLNGERPVTTSASEHAAGTELNNIKNYPDKGTSLQKMLSSQQAISTEAESMRAGLQAEDKASPLDATAEKTKVSNLVNSNLPEDIQQKLTDGKTLPNTAAGKYYRSVLDAVNDYNGTREGKLDLRQTIDGAYRNARGKLAFGSDSGNIIDETNTDIRDGLNKDLANTTKNTDTSSSLQKQSNLYRASDVLTAKAQAESATAYGRLEQKYPSLKNLTRIAQRQGIMIPIRIAEGAIGIGLVASYLRKAIAGSN